MKEYQRIHCQSWPVDSDRSASTKRIRSQQLYQHILETIAQQSGYDRSNLSVMKSTHGKPQVMYYHDRKNTPMDDTHISVSHCRHFSVWTCQPQPCAIDIEPIDAHRSIHRLLPRLLERIDWAHGATHECASADVESEIVLLSDDDRAILFYRLWTFCESWCKWHGQTLWQTLAERIPFPWPSLTHCLREQVTTLSRSMQIHYDFDTASGCLICLLSTP